MFGLDYLISPFSSDDFIESYWGKKALYIPGDLDKYAGLYSWETVNDLLLSSRSYSGLRLLHEKKGLPRSSFNNLDEWLEKGATLVVNSVNQVDPVMAKFQDTLEYELNRHVNINSYMSYPAKQGFYIHFDFHDVFIVHTEGEKEWKVFLPTEGRTYPLHKQPNQKKGEPPDYDPYLECTLTPGDVIYIPRGHWHYAIAVTPSIHLTVGPESRSGSELLYWWARRLMEDEDDFYRQDFPIIRSPMMGGQRDDKAYRQHMAAFRDRMKAKLDDEAFMDELLTRFCMLSNRQGKEYNLPSAWNQGKGLEVDTPLTIKPGQKFVVHYDEDSNEALLVIRGKELNFEDIPKDILAVILSAQGDRPVCGSDLLKLDTELEWETAEGWLKRLCRQGLLTLA